MAATVAGARLTEAHRLAQASLGARATRELLLLWSLVDPKRLDDTVPAWLEAVIVLLQVRRVESANLAASYLTTFRLVEAPLAPAFSPVSGAALDVQAAATSMRVTGPVSIKRAMQAGRSLAEAADTARVNTARAGMRHVLEGGRSTITATTIADPAVQGFRRVTSGDACGFCSVLARRGAVYSASTARFAAHDGCSCSAEPAYGGEGVRVAEYVPRNLTDAQRAEANRRVRAWIASEN